jgi:hypothetical protein
MESTTVEKVKFNKLDISQRERVMGIVKVLEGYYQNDTTKRIFSLIELAEEKESRLNVLVRRFEAEPDLFHIRFEIENTELDQSQRVYEFLLKDVIHSEKLEIEELIRNGKLPHDYPKYEFLKKIDCLTDIYTDSMVNQEVIEDVEFAIP